MAIKNTVTEREFIEAFNTYNRKENFSILGRKMLFQYLVNLSESISDDIELDIIGLCCQYSEVEKSDFLSDFDFDGDVDDESEVKAFIENQEGFISFVGNDKVLYQPM